MATWHLLLLSTRRLIWTRQTIISLFIYLFACVIVGAWSTRFQSEEPARFIEQMFLGLFGAILLPIICLSYGTAGIATDREEKTLVYLLVSPLPRPLVFLAKSSASLLLTMIWTLGGLAIFCLLGRKAGMNAWGYLWPTVFWTTICYVMLYLLFSVTLRRATVVAMTHALFIELFVGNLPGIAKRFSISFFFRSMILDRCRDLNLNLEGSLRTELFKPITGTQAQVSLLVISALLFVISLISFSRREYPTN